MGYLPSLGSKAAHLVSDITTVLLNPLSDHEHSKPPDEEDESSDTDQDNSSLTSDGPDTSSFSAFLISLLSPDSHSDHMEKDLSPESSQNPNQASTSEPKSTKGKKGILSRGKQSIGKILNKAARISRFRPNSELKSDGNSVQHAETVALESEPETAHVTVPGPVESAPQQSDAPLMSEPSVLMSEDMRTALYSSLPVLVQGRHWVLLYSTWRHGISLSTLYRRSALCPGYSLLIVGDKKGAVFGGLVEAPLQPTNKKKYQGTNSSFVFADLASYPVIYRPTGANHYFTLCATDSLALGGGGHFALYLDGDLLTGSSSTSDTFNNPCLAHSEDFEVKEVELWGFVYSSQYDEMVNLCRIEKPGICRW
ncbi:Oxidation resistance protein 1 [Rhynchospora pubera]|uniref:Oxidation resistance protein 1 n=1 Tax=Rhynchospora pubera TaxID=906938 RepID=A0AAV8CQT5_9POAL|nr:Oxidation resistance protein 1 [Rhynchospora pubera]